MTCPLIFWRYQNIKKQFYYKLNFFWPRKRYFYQGHVRIVYEIVQSSRLLTHCQRYWPIVDNIVSLSMVLFHASSWILTQCHGYFATVNDVVLLSIISSHRHVYCPIVKDIVSSSRIVSNCQGYYIITKDVVQLSRTRILSY